MDNSITTWQQGVFVDQTQYRNWTDKQKDEARASERLLVRPGLKRNAICKCNEPLHAIWIANRLNLAARLEQMTYDFATGKTDGSEIIDFVKKSIN